MTRDLDEVQTRVPWYGVPAPHVDPEVQRAVRGRVPDNHADFDGQRTTYGGRSPSPHDAAPPSEPPAPVSEPAGRGAAWTEERGTSDEGRRRSEGGMGRRAGPGGERETPRAGDNTCSEPAGISADADGVDAVARVDLADRVGQVVADGCAGQR